MPKQLSEPEMVLAISRLKRRLAEFDSFDLTVVDRFSLEQPLSRIAERLNKTLNDIYTPVGARTVHYDHAKALVEKIGIDQRATDEQVREEIRARLAFIRRTIADRIADYEEIIEENRGNAPVVEARVEDTLAREGADAALPASGGDPFKSAKLKLSSLPALRKVIISAYDRHELSERLLEYEIEFTNVVTDGISFSDQVLELLRYLFKKELLADLLGSLWDGRPENGSFRNGLLTSAGIQSAESKSGGR